ncbi:MAG TPA: hypothetical protein VKN36_07785 [Eudoraea sp.]|nr:hypothetical protein [Eudoraea sp.]
MPFLKRLGFYLIGLSFGLVILAFFFKKKSEKTGAEFCYLPNCRVLKDLRSKPLSYSEDISLLLRDRKLDSTDIALFLRAGDVNFKRSDTRSEPCTTFVINATLHDRDAVLTVRNCENEVVVETMQW